MKAINSQMKLVALSVSLLMSVDATAGLGGLRVNSSLGQPFSASVVVTGDEAKELLNGGKVSVSDSRLRTSVQKSGNNAVVTLRSSSAINDPVMIFQMGVGSQARQYTAIIDPPGYRSNSGSRSANVSSHQGDNGSNNVAAAPSRPTPSTSPAATPSNSRMPVLVQSQQPPQPIVAPSSDNTTSSEATTSSTSSASTAKSEASRQPASSGKLKRGSRYQAKSGETLNAIAARARPAGLSLEETKRAIIRANPHLFRKGSTNRALTGATLYIPTSAELSRLGRRPAQAPATAAAAGAAAGVAAMAVVPTENTASETTTSTPAAAVASATQTPAVASAPTVASAAMPVVASAASEAAASEAASEAVASEASVVAPPVQAPVVEQPPVAESTDDSLPWQALVFGGVGISAFLVLLWVLSKRKGGLGKRNKAASEETDPFGEGKTIPIHQPIAKPSNPPVVLTKEAAAAQMAAANAAKDDEFDDLDGDIFFEEITKVEDSKNDLDDFDFSSLDLDKQQTGIVSSAITNDKETQNRKNLDWDKVESTESVYEPDDLADIKPISKPAEAVSLSKPAPATPVADEFDLDNWDIDVNQSMPTASTAKPAAPSNIDNDDVSFESLDFSSSDDLSFTEPAKPVVEEPKEPERMSWASSVPREPAKPVFFDLTKETPEPLVIPTGNQAAPAKPVVEPAPAAVEVKPAPIAAPEPVAAPAVSVPEIEFEPIAVEPVVEKAVEPIAFEPVVEKAVESVAAPALATLATTQPSDAATASLLDTVESFDLNTKQPAASASDSMLEAMDFAAEQAVQPVVTPEADALQRDNEIEAMPSLDIESFDLAEKPTVAPVEPVAAQPAPAADNALDFEVEIPEIPEPVAVQAEPVAPKPEPSPVAPVFEPAPAVLDNTLSWGNDDDIGLADVQVPSEVVNPAVEWSDIQVEVGSTTVADPGFVSESVGMTAPLEAKYELAEMYIEIGDPDAARETLLELIEESSGEIQAKSQALLNTLS